MAPVEGANEITPEFLQRVLFGIRDVLRKRGNTLLAWVFMDLSHYRRTLAPIRAELCDQGFRFVDCPPIQKHKDTEERVDRLLEATVRGYIALGIRPSTFVIATADNGYGTLIGDLKMAGHHVLVVLPPGISVSQLSRGAEDSIRHPITDPKRPLESIRLQEALDTFAEEHGETIGTFAVQRPYESWTDDDTARFQITVLLSAFMGTKPERGYSFSQLKYELRRRIAYYGVHVTQGDSDGVDRLITFVINRTKTTGLTEQVDKQFQMTAHPLHAFVQEHWAPTRRQVFDETRVVKDGASPPAEAFLPWARVKLDADTTAPTDRDAIIAFLQEHDKLGLPPSLLAEITDLFLAEQEVDETPPPQDTTPESEPEPEPEIEPKPELEIEHNPVEIFRTHGRTLNDDEKKIGSKKDLLKILQELGLAQRMSEVAPLIWTLTNVGVMWIETVGGKKTYHFLPDVEESVEQAS